MPTVGAYVRISEDPDDVRSGVKRQREDCEKESTRRQWGNIDHWYEDNDVSAWRKTATRHAWKQMLADITAGVVDRVVVYDLDRLVRQPRDLEDLIDLAEASKVRVAGVSAEIDLTTDSGITMARVLTAFAWKSSADTARRVSRQKRARAEAGKGPGSRFRTFGYTRDFEVIESEAETVRDMFKRAAAGESLQSITKDLNARGILTTASGPWRRTTVANLIRRPGYAGLAILKGEPVGETSYPAIVPEDVWTAAQRDEGGPGFNARVYLLSGIATCSLCHSPMYGYSNGRYSCKPDRPGSCGKVSIKGTWLDTAVFIALSTIFHDEAEQGDAEPGRDYEAEVSTIDGRIHELQAAHAREELTLADLLPMLKAEREKRAALMREQAAEAAERSALQVAGDTLESFLKAPLSAQRVRIKKHWQAVIVTPTTAAGRRRFDPERLQMLWTDGRLTPYEFKFHSPEIFDVHAGIFADVRGWGTESAEVS